MERLDEVPAFLFDEGVVHRAEQPSDVFRAPSAHLVNKFLVFLLNERLRAEFLDDGFFHRLLVDVGRIFPLLVLLAHDFREHRAPILVLEADIVDDDAFSCFPVVEKRGIFKAALQIFLRRVIDDRNWRDVLDARSLQTFDIFFVRKVTELFGIKDIEDVELVPRCGFVCTNGLLDKKFPVKDMRRMLL